MRKIWGVSQGQKLVGIVARLNPIKDHSTFIKMAARCYQVSSDLKFVFIGDHTCEDYRRELQDLATKLLPPDAVIWESNCENMTAAYSALDVLVLTSRSESFPNAIGEGMSCGLRVVATDAGDARSIIGDTGQVEAVGDLHALAAAVLKVLADRSHPPHTEVRERIVSKFSVNSLLDRTLTLIGETVAKSGGKSK